MNAGAWILCTEWTTDGGSAGAFEGVRVATNDQFISKAPMLGRIVMV
jgi:hypothetical protein